MVVVCWLKIDNFWLKLNYFSSTYPRLDFGMMLQSTMREFNWIDMSKNLMWALQTILSWSLGWKGSTRNAQINADYPYFDCIQINPAYLRGIFPKTFDYTHTSGFERNNVELDGDHSQKVLFCFEHLSTRPLWWESLKMFAVISMAVLVFFFWRWIGFFADSKSAQLLLCKLSQRRIIFCWTLDIVHKWPIDHFWAIIIKSPIKDGA